MAQGHGLHNFALVMHIIFLCCGMCNKNLMVGMVLTKKMKSHTPFLQEAFEMYNS